MNATSISEREGGLHRGLSKAQIVMIGLGGAIGTGLFMGSGIAIGYAGPAVILSYALAGVVALVMVFSLSEMAVVHPTAGSFGTYAETYLNPWAGFVVRYTYWISQVIAIGGEAVAAGLYMTFWFPDVPVWMWSLGFSLILLYFNSRSVNNFGTIEFWFSTIKSHRDRVVHHPGRGHDLRPRPAGHRLSQPDRAAGRLRCRTVSAASGWPSSSASSRSTASR